MKTRKQWDSPFRALKDQDCQARFKYAGKQPSKMKKTLRHSQKNKNKDKLSQKTSSNRSTKGCSFLDRNSRPHKEIQSTAKVTT
jgi:hypothetical protein